ncbi:hypothetical protein F4780DRAFT_406931 [Xylariomycetidae sp. FL0641]|nr:hypothetical protein F4780DRAFT_406931 [Xylariomycetidae sp. FL0641]
MHTSFVLLRSIVSFSPCRLLAQQAILISDQVTALAAVATNIPSFSEEGNWPMCQLRERVVPVVCRSPCPLVDDAYERIQMQQPTGRSTIAVIFCLTGDSTTALLLALPF